MASHYGKMVVCVTCNVLKPQAAYTQCQACYQRTRYNTESEYRSMIIKHAMNWQYKRRIKDPHLTCTKLAIKAKRVQKYKISDDVIHTLTIKARRTVNCKYCGIKLWFNGGKGRLDAASLDRIDNGDMISADTCQWICLWCNRAKSNLTEKEFLGKIKTIYEVNYP